MAGRYGDPKWREEIDYDYVRDHFGPFFDDVLDLMDEHDPMGFHAPEGHYRPEVATILLRMEEEDPTCEADVLAIVHEEFTRWFTSAVDPSDPSGEWHAGPREAYKDIAAAIWSRWRLLPRQN